MARSATAHPGSGIVVDRAGRVFFVLFGPNRIMLLEPDGRSRVFAEDDRWLRLHHLVLDSAGNLYTASDHDGRIWRVAPDGRVEEFFHLPPSGSDSGIAIGRGGDPFTVDAHGNVYALDRPSGSAVVRITPAGEVSRLAGAASFGSLHFSAMAWRPGGDLYLSDGTQVWKISPAGDAVRLALGGESLGRATGLAVDSADNVYVADYTGHRVWLIRPDGNATVAPGTERLRLRAPVGVALGPRGDLYVTDFPGGVMSVWRVTGDGVDRVYGGRDLRSAISVALVTLLALTVTAHTWLRRPAGKLDWAVWSAVAGLLVALLWLGARNAPFLWYGRHLLAALYLAAAVASYRRIRLNAASDSRVPARQSP